MTKPINLAEALKELGGDRPDFVKWQLLAIILKEFALAKGISLDEPIQYKDE